MRRLHPKINAWIFARTSANSSPEGNALAFGVSRAPIDALDLIKKDDAFAPPVLLEQTNLRHKKRHENNTQTFDIDLAIFRNSLAFN